MFAAGHLPAAHCHPLAGRTRLVKGDGEIIEAIVSKQEQQRMRQYASRVPSSAVVAATQPAVAQHWTGKTKWPSQHPWFGYGGGS